MASAHCHHHCRRGRTGEGEGGVREVWEVCKAGPACGGAAPLTRREGEQSYCISVFRNHFKMTSCSLVKKPLEWQIYVFINIAFY